MREEKESTRIEFRSELPPRNSAWWLNKLPWQSPSMSRSKLLVAARLDLWFDHKNLFMFPQLCYRNCRLLIRDKNDTLNYNCWQAIETFVVAAILTTLLASRRTKNFSTAYKADYLVWSNQFSIPQTNFDCTRQILHKIIKKFCRVCVLSKNAN